MEGQGVTYKVGDAFYIVHKKTVVCMEVERIFPWPGKNTAFYQVISDPEFV